MMVMPVCRREAPDPDRADMCHARRTGMTTYCGRDLSMWLKMTPMRLEQAQSDPHFCKVCLKKILRESK